MNACATDGATDPLPACMKPDILQHQCAPMLASTTLRHSQMQLSRHEPSTMGQAGGFVHAVRAVNAKVANGCVPWFPQPLPAFWIRSYQLCMFALSIHPNLQYSTVRFRHDLFVPLTFASTTSVPAFWMRSISFRASSSLMFTAGWDCSTKNHLA